MPETKIKTILKLKRGNSSSWETENPILRDGEPGWDADNKILKIGDGTTAWQNLPGIKQNNFETGTILSTAVIPSDSDKTLSGTYELNGDYCSIAARAGTATDTNSMVYSLPVATYDNIGSFTLGIILDMICIIKAQGSTLEITTLDDSNFIRPEVTFTIRYKYK